MVALPKALPGASVSVSRHFEEEEYAQLNQRTYGILDINERTCLSQFDNPTFNPSTIVDSFNNLALQQKQQQRKNEHLFHLVAKLSEKIDDLKATRSVF